MKEDYSKKEKKIDREMAGRSILQYEINNMDYSNLTYLRSSKRTFIFKLNDIKILIPKNMVCQKCKRGKRIPNDSWCAKCLSVD